MSQAASQPIQLVLLNARVLTQDPTRPVAQTVAVSGGRTVWVGDDPGPFLDSADRRVDCLGATLAPGFVDGHLHLLAYAASLMGVDCGPRAVDSIPGIQDALRTRASESSPGTWVRGWGYDELALTEGRHPTRADLDAAASAHPIKLTHRSGHACVLNSRAMELLGIGPETPEPRGGTIDRDVATGELTGYFLEMEGELESKGVPSLTSEELERGLSRAVDKLLAFGITSLHEATPTRAMEQWEMLETAKLRGSLPIGVVKMFGPGDLDELARRGLGPDSEPVRGLRTGAIKFMLNETGPRVLPAQEELRDQVAAAHRAGYQAAFHTVEEHGLRAVLDAVSFLHGVGLDGVAARRHRIEHCGICPPELVRRIRDLGLTVVTQPIFIAEHGDRYLAQIEPERHGWLYRCASLRRAGVPVAFGSDAPVAPLDPWAGIAAAVTRRSRSGAFLAPEEAVPIEEALAMYTGGGAFAALGESAIGRIAPGYAADFVLLSADPLGVDADALGTIRVEKTIVGGEIVWER
jgi:hypothetical protein